MQQLTEPTKPSVSWVRNTLSNFTSSMDKAKEITLKVLNIIFPDYNKVSDQGPLERLIRKTATALGPAAVASALALSSNRIRKSPLSIPLMGVFPLFAVSLAWINGNERGKNAEKQTPLSLLITENNSVSNSENAPNLPVENIALSGNGNSTQEIMRSFEETKKKLQEAEELLANNAQEIASLRGELGTVKNYKQEQEKKEIYHYLSSDSENENEDGRDDEVNARHERANFFLN